MRRFAGLVLAVCAAAACGATPSETDTDPDPAVRAEPGEVFTLAVGEAAEVEDGEMVIELLEVAGDSRCPVDVTCVWAGDAVAAIEVVHAGVEYAFGLHLNPGEPTSSDRVDVGGYRIELEAVEPEARSDVTLAQGDYRVTFRVTGGD